jgi:hypothetical protein
MNMAGSLKLKFGFYFTELTHQLSHLDKLSFVHWKIKDVPTPFDSLFYVTDLFNKTVFPNFEVMLG